MSDLMEAMPFETDKTKKRRIVKQQEFEAIRDYIDRHQGLAIDCQIDVLREFPQFETLTLKSILEITLINQTRNFCWRYDANAENYLKIYEQRCKQTPGVLNSCILLDIARSERIGPASMCRALLKVKYKHLTKHNLNDMIRSPHIIDDAQLSANVAQCVCSDTQNGPLVDLKRRILGEEYEVKLKQMATAAGMHYFDENDLRRLGYDKTPDIKMILPFLYNGEVINWIESKANFGGIKTHKSYIHQQLNSYCNRFGPGIVIYWFGYVEETSRLPDNSIGIIVLDKFPAKEDIQLIDLSDARNSDDLSAHKDDELSTQQSNT